MGTQLCSWENSESIEIQSMRDRLALVAERAWNPQAGGTFAEFKSRLAAHGCHPREARPSRRHSGAGQVRRRRKHLHRTAHADARSPSRPGLTLKYTLDNSLPNERWQTYTGPITVDQTVHLRAGLVRRRRAGSKGISPELGSAGNLEYGPARRPVGERREKLHPHQSGKTGPIRGRSNRWSTAMLPDIIASCETKFSSPFL